MKDNLEIIETQTVRTPDAPDSLSADKFSWKRVWAIFIYWWPRLRIQFCIYIGISLVVGPVAGFFDLIFDSVAGSQIQGVCSYLGFLGPAIFAMKKGRELDVTLPARNSEKTAFFLIYSLVLLLLMYPMSITYWLINGNHLKSMLSAEMAPVGLENMFSGFFYDSMWLLNVGYSMSLSMICLYCAIFFKRNAVIKSICVTFAALWGPSLIVGFMAGIHAFEIGYNQALGNMPPSPDQVVARLMPWLSDVMIALTVTLVIAMFVLLWLFIRNFPKRQVL